ncbi:MAG: sigma-70 family RNA polymerase sigma factor [Opitutaceae bacterium]|nr:sigma-70 family RNA polymerase sigma factor [Opitutaceae bacterium]
MLPFDADALRQHRIWVNRMASGDAEALTELHHAYVSILFGIARRILHDPEDVREVVQDTFVKAWNQAGQYRPERGEVSAWLVFMVRNTAIDRLRQRTRRAHAVAGLADDLAGEQDLQPAPHEDAERRDLLAHTLTELSTEQRRALELAFFNGCSQHEIAQAMSAPVGNVKNYLRRGLLKLRQLASRHD